MAGYWNNAGANPVQVTWQNPVFTPEGMRDNGGWYYNPASGMVERWWGEGTGPGAGQQTNNNAPGGTTPMTESVSFPEFDFNFEDEQTKAYESLKPFYEKIVSFAQGDMDLAKRILKYTYDQGMRENQQDFDSSSAEAGRLTQEETSRELTEQNRRGILESGFGQQDRARTDARQSARAEAIQRAYENRSSRLGSEQTFGVEKEDRGFERNQFETERDRRNEARGIASNKFGIEQSQYQVALTKAQREEAERLRNLEQQSQKDFYDQYGYNLGGF